MHKLRKLVTYKIFVLANVSMGVSACLFMIIVGFHSYRYVYLSSRFHRKHRMRIKEIADTIKQSFKRAPKRQDVEELVTDQGDTL